MSIDTVSAMPAQVSDQLLANAIRALTMDAVQKANSGHPGMPMGMADIAVALWKRHLRHNPANPHWANRDRFVLSNGHGSMLQYALLHLTGYALPMDEIRNFRQLHSMTPGHPELGVTPGVETTTGPLGQGLANAVGIAIAERVLAAEFNRPGFDVVDHHTYVFLGDGCLMEGISHEACSLAGTLGLHKLIAVYDDNGISIDGHVEGWFRDDTPQRFMAYGWHVIPKVDGHNVEEVDTAIREALAADKPTLICCKTIIGKGAPNKQGSEQAHGAALGDKEVAAARERLDWKYPPFEIPQEIYACWSAKESGAEFEKNWNETFAAYQQRFPHEAAEFLRRTRGDLPAGFAAHATELLGKVIAKGETIATRKASQNAIEALVPLMPELIGGSADLAGSNLTHWPGAKVLTPGSDEGGKYINYGVREFGMSAIMNGIALHGGLIPYGGTFLTFSDYARNALRMAALMKLRVIFVYTHDSIGLGEDGPTHQSVEHASSLRIMPNMDVWRPCDTAESVVAWAAAVERQDGPSSLLFSRQNLRFMVRDAAALAAMRRGGYVLADAPSPRALIIATGSEVALAIDAQQALAAEGIAVRVVSMPCTNVFDRQDAAYRASVLTPNLPRVAVEAGITDFWRKYVGAADSKTGAVVGIDRFGESAPGGELFKFFGFTTEHVVKAVKGLL
jgi:transketolase